MADKNDDLVPEKRMDDMSVAPGDPKKEKAKGEHADEQKPEDAPRDEENLEEGLEDSMDGSDPASATQP